MRRDLPYDAVKDFAPVTMLARDGDETFEADPETERMLLDAIAQFERGDTMPFPQLLGQLRDRE